MGANSISFAGGGAAYFGGRVALGGSAANAELQFPNTINNRKLILWDNNAASDVEFFGLGINGGLQRYQVPTGSNHVFYTGGAERLRIREDGYVSIPVLGNGTTRTLAVDGNGYLVPGGVYTNTFYNGDGTFNYHRNVNMAGFDLNFYNGGNFLAQIRGDGYIRSQRLAGGGNKLVMADDNGYLVAGSTSADPNIAAVTHAFGNITLNTTNRIVFTHPGSAIVTLPGASSVPGRMYSIKNVSGSGITVTSSSQFFYNTSYLQNSVLLTTNAPTANFVSDGSVWYYYE